MYLHIELAGQDNTRHTLKTTGGTEMQQLTGMDASFLALETATTTGHVGGLLRGLDLVHRTPVTAGLRES